MMGKVLLFGLLAGATIALVSQRQDVARYIKIKQMSLGRGFPQYVPAEGQHRYPAPGRGAPDGTGDFDSAGRGGPALMRR
ncbi:MAG TPA: hypothetical protein VEL03_15120 [Streptosporangiaceae bacterium]|nr:hypothetical protein [Streptosporangiaceae bacterium]